MESFGVNRARPDGLQPMCKLYYQENAARNKRLNPEKILAKDRKYQSEHREYYQEKARKWVAAHPGYGAASHARTYVPKPPRDKMDPEEKRRRSNEAKKSWRKANPDKERERNHARNLERRALLAGAPEVERVSRQEIIDRDGLICYLCQQPIGLDDLHIDHVVPISRGGTGLADNLAPTHSWCNGIKCDKLLEELDWSRFRP